MSQDKTLMTNIDNTNDYVLVTPVIIGSPLKIGSGFNAKGFREKDFYNLMDPLVMVDHYTMTEPTFGAHPHAGLSAVSVLFEDSAGQFNNRDSLGNNFDLAPGDLYWLKAGSGVIHDEAPRAGAKIHGLQVFINLPAEDRRSTPASLHVKAEDMPVINENGARVRVVLGEHNGVKGQMSPSLPMTILDGSLDAKASHNANIQPAQHVWIYAVSGDINLRISGRKIKLTTGQAIAMANNSQELSTIAIHNDNNQQAKFALFSGVPIKQEFVQKGPLIMSNWQEMQQVEADYAAGKFGQIN